MNPTGAARCVSRAGAVLGEGPVWSETRNAILWVDIKGQRLHRYCLDTGTGEHWDMPERICWVAERVNGGLIAGQDSGFAFIDTPTMTISSIGHPEKDRPGNRFNDAKVDPQGRLWAGTMHDTESEPTGALYCLRPDLTWRRHDEGYIVSNGPAFSPDGRILYHCSSATREVFRFDLHDDGTLSNKRLFIRLNADDGYPDGITTDADGGLWVARWLGWGISRYRPDGRLDRKIPLPVARVTSLTFAGPDLDRLFVTTASIGLGAGDRENQPDAGGLFEVHPDRTGLPTNKFRG